MHIFLSFFGGVGRTWDMLQRYAEIILDLGMVEPPNRLEFLRLIVPRLFTGRRGPE